MAIETNVLTGIQPVKSMEQPAVQQKQQPGKSFGSMLAAAIDDVSKQENESDKQAELLAVGKTDNLHNVMISAQKANIKVETAVQVQQKVLDAYNEVMRMQI